MLMTDAELKIIYKDLEKVFGVKAVEKIYSHIYSLERKIEDLKESRNMLKFKFEKLKEKSLKGG